MGRIKGDYVAIGMMILGKTCPFEIVTDESTHGQDPQKQGRKATQKSIAMHELGLKFS